MKCEVSLIDDNYLVSSVIIEKDRVYLKKGKEKQSLNVNFRDCFNTLISLFSLKESWHQVNCLDPFYQVEFEWDGCSEIYNFGGELPSNFYIFLAYINKLVGGSL